MQDNSLSRKEIPSLDWTAVLVATRAIANEVKVKPLLVTLSQVVLTNTGAQKTVIILSQENDLIVKVVARNDQIRFPNLTIRASRETPQKVIDYVIDTKAAIILNQPNRTDDPCFEQRSPLSMICLSLLKQSDLIGLLYLENPLEKGAFTDQQSNFLQILASQAAISLENVRLRQQLELLKNKDGLTVPERQG